jgi:hypothetical protein
MAPPPPFKKNNEAFMCYLGRTGSSVRRVGDFSYSLQVLYADLKRR